MAAISIRACSLDEILSFREQYRAEMNCQIIHDSIHIRPGWSAEYALEIDGAPIGYGSVAVGGPWKNVHTLYEFHVQPQSRVQSADLFHALQASCGAKRVETQTNDLELYGQIESSAHNLKADAILFEDKTETHLYIDGAAFRPSEAADVEQLKALELDDGAKWVVAWDGELAGAGGVLYHYNRPYGDVYMKIAEPFRRKGLGAYLVQELKRVCREGGSVPAARCNINNTISRKTLEKAGFAKCGELVSGEL